MDISEELTCLFTAEVEEHGQSYVLEVPKQEVDVGYVDPTEDYQVALVGTAEKPSQPDPLNRAIPTISNRRLISHP